MIHQILSHLPQTMPDWGEFAAHFTLGIAYAVQAIAGFRRRGDANADQ